jgi:hypothetical protein
MKRIIKLLNQHLGHTIDCVETPTKLHYAKLCCRDCGNHRGTKFLTWIGPRDMVTMGYWTEEQAKKQQQLKIAHKQKHRKQINKQAHKPTQWAQASKQERNFYQNYQPKSLTRSRTPTQLIGDRLALSGRSQYNGNPIGSVPVEYLKHILKTKINNRDDQAYIERHLQLRTGSYTGSPDTLH